MFTSYTGIPIVVTAVCIIICWALFAILCSILYENFAQLISERGRFMKQYLLQQLNDKANGIDWGALLYAQGSVDLYSRAVGKPSADIPSKIFAETLVEIVAGANVVKQKKKQLDIKDSYQSRLLNNFKAATEVLEKTALVSFLSQSLDTAELTAGSNESKIYKALTDNIENWYTGFTGRLTQWYKKQTKQRLFILGLILAMLFNIDSLQLFRYFESQPDARAALISYYEKNAATLNNIRDTAATPGMVFTYAQQFDSASKAATLPVGWLQYDLKASGPGNLYLLLFLKIIGFLVTALAASSGAPFWFDLLKKAGGKRG